MNSGQPERVTEQELASALTCVLRPSVSNETRQLRCNVFVSPVIGDTVTEFRHRCSRPDYATCPQVEHGIINNEHGEQMFAYVWLVCRACNGTARALVRRRYYGRT